MAVPLLHLPCCATATSPTQSTWEDEAAIGAADKREGGTGGGDFWRRLKRLDRLNDGADDKSARALNGVVRDVGGALRERVSA